MSSQFCPLLIGHVNGGGVYGLARFPLRVFWDKSKGLAQGGGQLAELEARGLCGGRVWRDAQKENPSASLWAEALAHGGQSGHAIMGESEQAVGVHRLL